MAKKTRSFFKKFEQTFNLPPVVPEGPNVFQTREYQEETGLSEGGAKDRLRKLAELGQVRKVRTKVNGKLVPAWEYVGDGANAN